MRIQASNIIALPVELRIQLLASSRDIIHSWAIPSAGIKLDCVPGYSSHKILFFLLSGIYWGQCMEICGRYHHWMPIIVYFMKRDLFFLWCTHFVINNKSLLNNNLLLSNNLLNNRLVSFDKNSWIENNNIIE
jgi:heme/copper-type cytochrome/quinol oxidase subunit 2